MKTINVETWNKFIKENVSLEFSVYYCRKNNDYVVHNETFDSIYSLGRFESFEKAVLAIFKNIGERGLDLVDITMA